MVGYSSVSHMGYVLMGLASMTQIGVNGAVLQMFAHGVMTALMFTNVGAIYDQAHIRDMTKFGGLAKTDAAACGVLDDRRTVVARLTGPRRVRRRVPDLRRRLPGRLLLGGRPRQSSLPRITATYILRMLALAYFGPFNERWDRAQGDAPARAGRRRAAHRGDPLHGPLAGAVHRPHQRTPWRTLPGISS